MKNSIKINKSQKMFAVICPPTKRNIVFGRKIHYLSFPEHAFVFRICPLSKTRITITGSFPFQFLLKYGSQYYDSALSLGNHNGEGGVCVDMNHESISGTVEKVIKTAMEMFWSVPYQEGTEGRYIDHKTHGRPIHVPKLTNSSIKELKSFVKEIYESNAKKMDRRSQSRNK